MVTVIGDKSNSSSNKNTEVYKDDSDCAILQYLNYPIFNTKLGQTAWGRGPMQFDPTHFVFICIDSIFIIICIVFT